MFILNICNELGFLNVIRFIKILFNIVCILVPIGLIVMLSIDFFKNVFNGMDFQKKNNKVILERLISAVLLFAVPYIINFVMSFIVDAGGDWASCYTNASKEQVLVIFNEKYAGITSDSLDDEIARKLSSDINYLDNGSLKDSYRDILNDYYDKKKNTSYGDDDTKTDIIIEPNDESPSSIVGKYIFIGDSRTVGLCTIVTGDYNGCDNSSNTPKISGDDIFIAKVGEGYIWFDNTAIPAMSNIIENSGSSYNIIINMGVNDLADVSSYINKYNKLKKTYSKHNIVIVSVNPVYDSRTKFVKNQEIVNFNSKVKAGLDSDIKYCDTYSNLIGNLNPSDYDSEGLHYSDSVYRTIYDLSKKCA